MTMKRMQIDVMLDDETEHRVTINNVSLVAYDRTRLKRQWPSGEEAPMLWSTFLAWHQMKAQGLVSCTLEEFETGKALAVQVVQEDEDEAAEDDGLDPTPPIPESDSSPDSPSPHLALSPPAEFLG